MRRLDVPYFMCGTCRTIGISRSLLHAAIRAWFARHGVPRGVTILYGGSVKPDNVRALVSEPEIDGVLVGGASVDVAAWLRIVGTACD